MAGTVLITGGSRGIGAATARLAAEQGYAVAINYRVERERAEALVAEIGKAGGQAIAVQADVAQQDEVTRLFQELDERLSRPSALVNAAGITGGPQTRVADFEQAVLERLLAVNVIGTMLCCREAVRRMSTAHGSAGGAIVNVSSMAATIGGRPRPQRLRRLQGGDRQLHHRPRQGGGAGRYPRKCAASRYDAHGYDRCGAARCRLAGAGRRDHSHEPLRGAGGDGAPDPVAAVRPSFVHFRRHPGRLGWRLHAGAGGLVIMTTGSPWPRDS
jgi:NAD(P)-dependent dehydrogenase (short-subunit alcohol dehydrogenase family)